MHPSALFSGAACVVCHAFQTLARDPTIVKLGMLAMCHRLLLLLQGTLLHRVEALEHAMDTLLQAQVCTGPEQQFIAFVCRLRPSLRVVAPCASGHKPT